MELTEYKLGELITQRREKKPENEDLPIRGVSKNGLIPPKQIEADTDIYNVYYRNDFVFNPARMELGSIAFNDEYDKAICSSLYEVFYVHRKDLVLPEFLALFVKQDEFARYCNFLSSGSAREYCRFANISEIKISLPSLEEQHRIVHDYRVVTDRIELLKKINDNLEEQVYSIYEERIESSTIVGTVLDIGEFVRGKNITAEEMIPGEYDVISAGISPSGRHNDFNVTAPSITISASGVNAGFVSYHFADIWAADCTYNNKSNYPIFLYCSLRKVKEKIEVLKDGHSAQPHVYAKDVNVICIPMLNEELLKAFEQSANIFFAQIARNIAEIKQLNNLQSTMTLKLS